MTELIPRARNVRPGSVAPTRDRTVTARILRVEVLDELRAIMREPSALFFSIAMTVVAAATGNLELSGGVWLRLVTALVIGALPFALIGLAVGFLASPNATTAILNALYIPSAVAGGLWMPLDTLPVIIQRVAPYTPTYHLAQLGLVQLEGGGGASHLLALGATAVVGAALATVAYRHVRP